MAARKQAGQENAATRMAALPGLGPASSRMLIEAGIADEPSLRAMGVEAAYRLLRFHHGRRVTTNFIYALEAALRGIHWTALEEARKSELREAASTIAKQLSRET